MRKNGKGWPWKQRIQCRRKAAVRGGNGRIDEAQQMYERKAATTKGKIQFMDWSEEDWLDRGSFQGRKMPVQLMDDLHDEKRARVNELQEETKVKKDGRTEAVEKFPWKVQDIRITKMVYQGRREGRNKLKMSCT